MFSFKKAAAGVLSCTMLLGSLVISGCSDSNTSGTQSADNTSSGSSTAHQGEIKDISSVELVKDMKIGWSLGNTLDAGQPRYYKGNDRRDQESRLQCFACSHNVGLEYRRSSGV